LYARTSRPAPRLQPLRTARSANITSSRSTGLTLNQPRPRLIVKPRCLRFHCVAPTNAPKDRNSSHRYTSCRATANQSLLDRLSTLLGNVALSRTIAAGLTYGGRVAKAPLTQLGRHGSYQLDENGENRCEQDTCIYKPNDASAWPGDQPAYGLPTNWKC
jgi:hypothetical protein